MWLFYYYFIFIINYITIIFIKTSNAMKNILCSLGIKVNQNFSALIQQSLHSLKKENDHNIIIKEITDSDNELDLITREIESAESNLSELVLNESCDIDDLLNQHQKRILNWSNLPENFNFSNNNLDEINNEDIQLVLEEDFFKKINRIFKKTHEINPIIIMQIMSDYWGNLS